MLAEQRYFFDQGLLFTCRRCGGCCTGAPGTVYLSTREVARLAGHLGMAPAELAVHYLYPYKDSYSIRENDRGDCLFFDQGCTIYPVRPFQCRAFPFWFGNLRSEAAWERVRRHCPGIGSGRRFTRARIMSLARRTTMI